jgi:translation initiation factor 1
MSKHSVNSLSDLYTLIPGAEPVTPNSGKDALSAMNIVLKIRIEKKGRGGKTVTVVTGFFHTKDDLASWARELKALCGAGGTVQGDTIEIQGNHGPKIAEWFRGKGFVVKQ